MFARVVRRGSMEVELVFAMLSVDMLELVELIDVCWGVRDKISRTGISMIVLKVVDLVLG